MACVLGVAAPGSADSLEPDEDETPVPEFTCPEDAPWNGNARQAKERTDGAIRDANERFGVPTGLLRSMIRHESGGRADAVSHSGAMGLMQLMPRTAEAMGVGCPFDPRENVLAGARYLRRLHDILGSWEKAVAGYHAGPGRIQAGELPPATASYQDRVIGTWERLR